MSTSSTRSSPPTGPRSPRWTPGRRVPFGERTIRVLCAEDDLRLVCMHYPVSGGWRSLSLCDVALVLETRPVPLDWALVLPDARRTEWLRLAATMAADPLGADLRATPLDGAQRAAPPRVRRHVLREFARTPADRPTTPFAPTTGPANVLGQVRDHGLPDALELIRRHRRAVPQRLPGHRLAYDVAARVMTWTSRGVDARRTSARSTFS